ncbi:MAG: hypothetical protein ACREBU_19965, partial [Nitrososphaera sp.]
MALAYLINNSIRHSSIHYRRISESVPLVYLLIAAIIPDLDLVFHGFIEHHALTHSVTFWLVVYLP